jgi:Glycosyl transferase family 11
VILLRLSGGLGNQLFQYAAGRQLADLHQSELVLDTHWYTHIPKLDTPRTYELGHYPVRARETTVLESYWCRLHGGRISRRLPFLPRRWKHFSEKGFSFDSAFLRLPDETYLDGYWQSYRYFEGVASLIRTELTPSLVMGANDRAIANLMNSTQSISIHVRRGDYVNNAASAQHGVCGLDYYHRAVNHLLDRVQPAHFFVFSDDPMWTRENLLLPADTTYVEHNDASTAFQDLRLMSLCKHHIVANSSFSWWGAWLNSDPGKVVVCPKQWFADGRDTSSLPPPDWARL